MKTIISIFLSFSLLIGANSCIIIAPKHDNGKHNGWHKNPKNPHNPAHIDANPKPGNNGNGKKKEK